MHLAGVYVNKKIQNTARQPPFFWKNTALAGKEVVVPVLHLITIDPDNLFPRKLSIRVKSCSRSVPGLLPVGI
jgi:hypothetical protein